MGTDKHSHYEIGRHGEGGYLNISSRSVVKKLYQLKTLTRLLLELDLSLEHVATNINSTKAFSLFVISLYNEEQILKCIRLWTVRLKSLTKSLNRIYFWNVWIKNIDNRHNRINLYLERVAKNIETSQ